MKSKNDNAVASEPTAIEETYVWMMLIRTPEGRIFLTGVALFVLFLSYLVLGWLWFPEIYQKVVSLTGMRLVVGRPAGVYFGYVLGLGHVCNFFINILIDTIVVFILYPLFVLSHRYLKVVQSVMNVMERTMKRAESNLVTIRRYGKPGLFLFVLFPLWGTGPVVGSVMGWLMGLRSWLNMTIVLGATYTAIGLWAILLTHFHESVLAYNPSSPMILIIVLFVFMIFYYLFRLIQRKEQ